MSVRKTLLRTRTRTFVPPDLDPGTTLRDIDVLTQGTPGPLCLKTSGDYDFGKTPTLLGYGWTWHVKDHWETLLKDPSQLVVPQSRSDPCHRTLTRRGHTATRGRRVPSPLPSTLWSSRRLVLRGGLRARSRWVSLPGTDPCLRTTTRVTQRKGKQGVENLPKLLQSPDAVDTIPSVAPVDPTSLVT